MKIARYIVAGALYSSALLTAYQEGTTGGTSYSLSALEVIMAAGLLVNGHFKDKRADIIREFNKSAEELSKRLRIANKKLEALTNGI
ncbi:hypothetical protein HYZ97_04085 [Candidatus Pacearchaeota archaeon]|nr:hypothetical protein [Candidatus Pacearchaeota archaeon]